MKKIKGFKAFNKGMECNGFKFKEGEVYEEEKAELCRSGFHFCENPLDVLNYYDLIDSEIHEVESLGKTDKETDKGKDTKTATTKIKIGVKLSLKTFIDASISFIMEKCKTEKASSGDYAKLASSGDYGIVAGIGVNNKAKGKKGNWIVLAEWKYDNKKNKRIPICVKSVKVDGKKIKEDTWYKLENKKFTEEK